MYEQLPRNRAPVFGTAADRHWVDEKGPPFFGITTATGDGGKLDGSRTEGNGVIVGDDSGVAQAKQTVEVDTAVNCSPRPAEVHWFNDLERFARVVRYGPFPEGSGRRSA